MPAKIKSHEEFVPKFFEKVSIPDGPDGCWIWTGARSWKGYGRVGWYGKVINADAASLILYGFGERPEGMLICHKCDNPPCVNPDHLFFGTPKDNTQDAVLKGRFNFVNAQTPPEVALAIFKADGTQREIAEKFGVTGGIVSAIKRGRTYTYMTGASLRHGGAKKLTWEIVRQIRQSVEIQAHIAKKFGLNKSTVRSIRLGKTWKEK